MAEKEERIYLFTDKMICENCKDWYEHIDPLDSPDCTECAPADFPYITRQKAINRMAKALIDIALTGHYSRFEDSCVVEDAIPYAKAALNALLEKGDEK